MQTLKTKADEERRMDTLEKQVLVDVCHSEDELLKLPHSFSDSFQQFCEHPTGICAEPICFLRRNRKNLSDPQFQSTRKCSERASDDSKSPLAERQGSLGTLNRQSFNRLVGLEIASEISKALPSDVSEQADEQVAFLLWTDPGFIELEEKES